MNDRRFETQSTVELAAFVALGLSLTNLIIIMVFTYIMVKGTV